MKTYTNESRMTSHEWDLISMMLVVLVASGLAAFAHA
ncbi:hypothetical protein JOC69_000619 [Heliobacterium gestii]|nr:hypothetical protein [Heliomicrobium gestii]